MTKVKKEFERIAFVASDVPEAQQAREALAKLYGDPATSGADVIVALGGDGLMLQTLHRFINDKIPIYGMNRGSVGFLMNDYRAQGLKERLAAANVTRIHPLAMVATDRAGKAHKSLAINEVSLFRERYQAAKLRISIDGRVRMEELICDGVLIATPAGSTAYNLSAHGAAFGADADQSVPPKALARCPGAKQSTYNHRRARSGKAPRQRRRRPFRDPRRRQS